MDKNLVSKKTRQAKKQILSLEKIPLLSNERKKQKLIRRGIKSPSFSIKTTAGKQIINIKNAKTRTILNQLYSSTIAESFFELDLGNCTCLPPSFWSLLKKIQEERQETSSKTLLSLKNYLADMDSRAFAIDEFWEVLSINENGEIDIEFDLDFSDFFE